MVRDLAVSRIAEGLGFRTDLADKIILRMQESQRLLEMGNSLPRFLLAEDQTINLLAANSSVALPTDFLRLADVDRIRYIPDVTTGKPFYITRKDFTDALESYYGDPAGPKVYMLRASSLYFLPLPDVAYTLTWTYYKKGALLDSNIENEWLANAPDTIIGDTGFSLASDLRNQAAMQVFNALSMRAKRALFGEIVASELGDAPIHMGSNL